MKKLVLALSAILLLVSTVHFYALAAEREAESNPYLELYYLRVSQAEANLKRQEAVLTLADKRLARGRPLITSNAISAEEYDTMVSEQAVAASDLTLATQKIQESKAYLRIIEAVVARGESIPLCTYEME